MKASFLAHLIGDFLEQILDLSLAVKVQVSRTTKMQSEMYVQTFMTEWITCKPF